MIGIELVHKCIHQWTRSFSPQHFKVTLLAINALGCLQVALGKLNLQKPGLLVNVARCVHI